jgi:hypothetical protein
LGRYINSSIRKFSWHGIPKYFQFLSLGGIIILALHYLLEWHGVSLPFWYVCHFLMKVSMSYFIPSQLKIYLFTGPLWSWHPVSPGCNIHLIISHDNHTTTSFSINLSISLN